MPDRAPLQGKTEVIELPKVALFDIDGTLFDTERLWAEALSLLMEETGHRQSPHTLSALTYGLAWPDAFRVLRQTFPDATEGYNAQTFGHQLCLRFDHLFALAPPVIEGAVTLLHFFNEHNIPCGYVSGSPRKTIETNLTRCKLTPFFDLTRSVPSDDMPHGKPHPEGYLLALKRFGVNANEAVAFEDSRVGSTAALAAGISTYVCPPPNAPLQNYPQDAIRLSNWCNYLNLYTHD